MTRKNDSSKVCGVMFDTNIFNHILGGSIAIDAVTSLAVPIFVTYVQHDELEATPLEERRVALLSIFRKVITEDAPTESFVIGVSRIGMAKISSPVLPTESAVWDVSRWDQAKWGDEDNLYTTIKRLLDGLNNSKKNNIHDALIAETAIKNGLTLITHDSDLRDTVILVGGKAKTWQEQES